MYLMKIEKSFKFMFRDMKSNELSKKNWKFAVKR